MRKLYITLFLFAFISAAFTQPCTPGPQTNPGIYPDSATGLPHAYANTYYETVITVVIPVDTIIETAMGSIYVDVDSIGIVSFQGLPPGFSYTPDRPTGFWPGGTKGCVLISGTHPDVGEFPLVIELEGYGGPFSMPFILGYYKIVIDSTHLSVEPLEKLSFELFQNAPNPFFSTTKISFYSDINETYIFNVFNMIGKVVYTKKIDAIKGLNTYSFDAQDLPDGFYFYQMSDGIRSQTKRMIVSQR